MKENESKAVVDLREVKWESQEMHNKFLQNQCALESSTQECERLRNYLRELDSCVKYKIDGMQFKDWEEKGCQSKGYP